MSAKKSLSQEAYAAFNCGEVNQEDLEKFIGLNVAETTSEHMPLPWPAVSDYVKDYCDQRLNCQIKRDPIFAVKNGEWIQAMNRIITANQDEYEFLIWSRDMCKATNAPVAVSRIESLIRRYTEQFQYYEKTYRVLFEKALQVQRKDSDERRRG